MTNNSLTPEQLRLAVAADPDALREVLAAPQEELHRCRALLPDLIATRETAAQMAIVLLEHPELARYVHAWAYLVDGRVQLGEHDLRVTLEPGWNHLIAGVIHEIYLLDERPPSRARLSELIQALSPEAGPEIQ
jgi:hypothetical protein